MSSVVLELQEDALNRTVLITDLLRKAFAVARKLKITDFEKWAESELNGYKDSGEIPEYRQINGSVHALNLYHGWQPVMFPDSEITNLLSNRPCGQSIAEIESLLEHDSKSNSLHMPFPPEMGQALRKAIGFRTQVTIMVPRTSLVRIVEAVRTIILNWSLRLEEDGIMGERLSFTGQEHETAERASYAINNFYAPVHSPQIQQQTTNSFQITNKLDISSLRELIDGILERIDELGLGEELKEKLNAEIKTIKVQIESPNPEQPILGECLYSIRRILEIAVGGVAGQLLIQLGKLIV